MVLHLMVDYHLVYVPVYVVLVLVLLVGGLDNMVAVLQVLVHLVVHLLDLQG